MPCRGDREAMIKYLARLGIRYTRITCDDCSTKDRCDWAYDADSINYNTDGDCMAEKVLEMLTVCHHQVIAR